MEQISIYYWKQCDSSSSIDTAPNRTEYKHRNILPVDIYYMTEVTMNCYGDGSFDLDVHVKKGDS